MTHGQNQDDTASTSTLDDASLRTGSSESSDTGLTSLPDSTGDLKTCALPMADEDPDEVLTYLSRLFEEPPEHIHGFVIGRDLSLLLTPLDLESAVSQDVTRSSQRSAIPNPASGFAFAVREWSEGNANILSLNMQADQYALTHVPLSPTAAGHARFRYARTLDDLGSGLCMLFRPDLGSQGNSTLSQVESGMVAEALRDSLDHKDPQLLSELEERSKLACREHELSDWDF